MSGKKKLKRGKGCRKEQGLELVGGVYGWRRKKKRIGVRGGDSHGGVEKSQVREVGFKGVAQGELHSLKRNWLGGLRIMLSGG